MVRWLGFLLEATCNPKISLLRLKEKMKNQIPAGRFCEPIEIYNTIIYLINTEYVNGSILDINGGIV